MTELTDRMRTCAAHIEAKAQDDVPMPPEVSRDAVNLLREAAFQLERYEEVEEQVLSAEATITIEQTGVPVPTALPTAYWVGDDLKPIPNAPISKNACPNCDSRTTKMVHVVDRTFELECPVCSFRWQR